MKNKKEILLKYFPTNEYMNLPIPSKELSKFMEAMEEYANQFKDDHLKIRNNMKEKMQYKNRFQIRKELIQYFTEYGYMKGDKFLEINPPSEKSSHGNCCTCQKCFYHHDDCICIHNKHLKKINEIFEYEESDIEI